MPGLLEKVQTINSFLRTLIALFVVGGAGAAGWYGYSTYYAADLESQRKEKELQDVRQTLDARERELAQSRTEITRQREQIEQKEALIADQENQIGELKEDVAKKAAEIQRLDTALRLHKLQRRLARLTVLEVVTDPASGKKRSRIEFVELNELGDPIGKPREFPLEGDLVYVDYWVVKFEDKYVETADLERGTSICLFHRIFGEFQNPNDGFSLDEPGTSPSAYARGGVTSELEKKIWGDFWNIANDPQQAAELGIRTLHGDAVSIKVTQGKTYRVTVRSSGGPEIEVEQEAGSAPPGR
jgi:archaellum component FlaC